MTTESSTISVRAMTTDILSFALKQGTSLTKKAKPIAAAIIAATESERSAIAHESFLAVRGESVAAKLSNEKVRAKAIGKQWNRIVDAIRDNLEPESLTVTFANLASGEGETVVMTKADANSARKAKRVAREEADQAALAAFQAERVASEIEALRAMSPDDMTAQIVAMLQAWSDDTAQQRAVVYAVKNIIAPTYDMLSLKAVA